MTACIGSLFSGSGMLDEAVRAHFGGEVAWYAEHEPPTEKNPNPSQAAARLLAYRYPDVPNLGDISAVDWSTVPRIDVLTGGFPCQDVSHAGKRAGMREGTRSGLWARMRDAIDQLRPAAVVAENVRGLLSAEADSGVVTGERLLVRGSRRPQLRALGRVLGDLAELGYDARWCGLRAADVGAPHGRFRVFIVATDAQRLGRGACASNTRRGPFGRDAAAGAGALVAADSAGTRRAEGQDRRTNSSDACSRPRCSEPQRDGGEPAADADSEALRQQPVAGTERGSAPEPGQLVQWGPYEPAIRKWERILGRPAPAPTEPGPKGGQRLSPRLTEWMMGWPDGWVTDVPGITRNEALRICGNGVVPQQAAAALRVLLNAEAVAS